MSYIKSNNQGMFRCIGARRSEVGTVMPDPVLCEVVCDDETLQTATPCNEGARGRCATIVSVFMHGFATGFIILMVIVLDIIICSVSSQYHSLCEVLSLSLSLSPVPAGGTNVEGLFPSFGMMVHQACGQRFMLVFSSFFVGLYVTLLPEVLNSRSSATFDHFKNNRQLVWLYVRLVVFQAILNFIYTLYEHSSYDFIYLVAFVSSLSAVHFVRYVVLPLKVYRGIRVTLFVSFMFMFSLSLDMSFFLIATFVLSCILSDLWEKSAKFCFRESSLDFPRDYLDERLLVHPASVRMGLDVSAAFRSSPVCDLRAFLCVPTPLQLEEVRRFALLGDRVMALALTLRACRENWDVATASNVTQRILTNASFASYFNNHLSDLFESAEYKSEKKKGSIVEALVGIAYDGGNSLAEIERFMFSNL